MKKFFFPALLLGLLVVAGCSDSAVEYNDLLVTTSKQCDDAISQILGNDSELNGDGFPSALQTCNNALDTLKNAWWYEEDTDLQTSMIQYVTTEVEYLKDLQKIYPFLQKQDLSDATEDELAEYSNLVDKIGQYESRMDTEFEAVEKAVGSDILN